MQLKQKSNVAVIGSGISSLTYSYFLTKLRPDVKITVYETLNRPSGYIHSEQCTYDDQLTSLEKGPRTLRSVSSGTLVILDLVKKLGLQDEVKFIKTSDVSNKKWLVASNGKDLIQLPNSWSSFFRFLIGDFIDLTKIGISLLKEPFVPKKIDTKDETVHQFFSRRFSPLITEKFLSAVYRGIYAGDVRKLSVNAVMPFLPKMEQEYGSVMKAVLANLESKELNKLLADDLVKYSETFQIPQNQFLDIKEKLKGVPMLAFSNGLSSFTAGLANTLKKNPNVNFKLNTPVKTIIGFNGSLVINGTDTFDYVRSSINSNKLMEIVGHSRPELLLNYVDIYMVNVFIPRNELKINGFGYLVPLSAENKEELLGCIFDSDIEKNSHFLFAKGTSLCKSKEYTKLTLMFGGHQWLGMQERPSDEEMKRRACSVIQRHLGITLKSSDIIDQTFIPQCIPQFEIGYIEGKQKFHRWLESEFEGKLSHGGMSYGDGCGVPDVVMNSFNHASAVYK